MRNRVNQSLKVRRPARGGWRCTTRLGLIVGQMWAIWGYMQSGAGQRVNATYRLLRQLSRAISQRSAALHLRREAPEVFKAVGADDGHFSSRRSDARSTAGRAKGLVVRVGVRSSALVPKASQFELSVTVQHSAGNVARLPDRRQITVRAASVGARIRSRKIRTAKEFIYWQLQQRIPSMLQISAIFAVSIRANRFMPRVSLNSRYS